MNYVAYTDGSYQDSIGAGGYGSVILDDTGKAIKILCNGFKHTTNNRMEIRGVIETLKHFTQSVNITIISDSQYVVKMMSEGHVKRWFKEKDYNKKNLDLWFELLDLTEFHNVSFEWVKGHNGNRWNELADKLSVIGARCLNIENDIWPQKSKLNELEITGIPV